MFNEDEVEDALKFLRIAKKDFEVAKILIDNKYYSQGLSMLQQAIEKSAKAIIRALGTADIKTLKKEIGHDILLKGLEQISYTSIGQVKTIFTDILINHFSELCKLSLNCPESLKYIEKALKVTGEGITVIQEWLNNKSYREIKKTVSSVGDVVFTEDENARKKLDEVFNKISSFVIDVIETFKESGIETIVTSIWRFMGSLEECARKKIKDRNTSRRIILMLGKQKREIMNLTVRIFYLMDIYTSLIAYHILFENRIPMLRYPAEKWSPLSISNKSIILIMARRIIEFMDRQELLDVIEDLVLGKYTHNRSIEIYKELEKYINQLK